MAILKSPAKTYVALDIMLEDGMPRVLENDCPVFMWGAEVGKVDSYLVGTSNVAVLIIPNHHFGAGTIFTTWSESIKSVELTNTQITVIM